LRSTITSAVFAEIKTIDPDSITDEIKTKIENATNGLTCSYSRGLGKLPPKHITIIYDYISALRSEIKLSDKYRQSILTTLTTLSRINNKDFTRADVITYLNHFSKDESIGPLHKWIGTCNTNLVNVAKFFKWLYHHDIESAKRSKPKVIQNLPKLKRGEISGYKPSDMWDAKDTLLD